MTPAEIQLLIESHLPDCSAEVVSEDLTHYEARVISGAFAGQRPLQRHQLVYQALGERMGREIHALSIAAYTPEEWAAREG
jgi:acid stress-induced BolA-like protein IbaG/YrbA